MNKATNIFIIGVVLLGSAFLRILESLIHRIIPLWLLFILGGFLFLYGLAAWREEHPPEKKSG